MPKPEREAERVRVRAVIEANRVEAVRRLAESLHGQFCGPDHEAVGGWDEAVVMHVLRDYESLPLGLHSAMLHTLAMEQATKRVGHGG